MSNAKRCDVCYNYYTPDEIDRPRLFNDSGYVYSISLKGERLVSHEDLDLCPRCASYIYIWIENKRHMNKKEE